MIVHIATLFLLTFTNTNAELEEIAGWRFLTFAPPAGFPGASPLGYPIYAPTAVFTGFQATEDRFFLAMPRFQPGVPATLGWVPRPLPGTRLPLDTPIQAFPDWEWHRAAAAGAASASAKCSALVNVFRTRVDRCGRLWVLDSGVSDTLTNFTVSCLPKLLAFNATTGEVLRRIEFRAEVLRINSLLTNMALDSRSPPGSSCLDPDDMFIYVADTTAPGIVVYDVRKDAAWRHTAPQMYPDPDKGIFKVAGESFTLMDGIIGLTLSNPVLLPTYRPDMLYSERLLYFQAFASDRIYSIPTSALQAEPKDNEELPIKLVGHKSSQAAPIIVDPKDDSLIFSPVSETAIASWQPAQNILGVKAYNPNLLQFVLDFGIEPEQIFAISTRMQKFVRRTATAEEVNLRILRIETARQYGFH